MTEFVVALGADHGGFELKEAIKDYLYKQNIEYIDFGTSSTESVDYPDYAGKVANSIISHEASMGILCCGTGIGISIAANKFPGIRAAVCNSEFCAEMARRHNNANILCLGGRVITKETAVNLTKIFLNTPFDAGRHQVRLDQIAQIELENKLS